MTVCLQQPAIRSDLCVVRALLCASKLLRRLVADNCTGALALQGCMPSDKLAAWLARHGTLVSVLELPIPPEDRGSDSPRQAPPPHHPMAHVLVVLPSTLTRLVLREYHGQRAAAGFHRRCAASLAVGISARPLRQLRALELPSQWRDAAAAPVLPALATLTALERLSMPLLVQPELHALARHLPPQLAELALDCVYGEPHSTSDNEWLALTHLGALTSLDVWARVDGGALPASLRRLVVADCPSAAPLLRLQQLTSLQLSFCRTGAEELRRLSALQSLQELHVDMDPDGDDALLHASGAFGVLPLTQLWVPSAALSAACLENLRGCKHLTSLGFGTMQLAPGATLEQVAAALSSMTALQRLRCAYAWHPQQGQEPPPAGGWRAIAQALARLPELRTCKLTRMMLGPAAVQLADAAQLTALTLCDCGVTGSAVVELTSRAKSLRELNVDEWKRGRFGDSCLACIAAAAPQQLTALSLGAGVDVSDAAVQQLTAAMPRLCLSRMSDNGFVSWL